MTLEGGDLKGRPRRGALTVLLLAMKAARTEIDKCTDIGKEGVFVSSLNCEYLMVSITTPVGVVEFEWPGREHRPEEGLACAPMFEGMASSSCPPDCGRPFSRHHIAGCLL